MSSLYGFENECSKRSRSAQGPRCRPFSVRGQMLNISGFEATGSLSCLLTSVLELRGSLGGRVHNSVWPGGSETLPREVVLDLLSPAVRRSPD